MSWCLLVLVTCILYYYIQYKYLTCCIYNLQPLNCRRYYTEGMFKRCVLSQNLMRHVVARYDGSVVFTVI